MIVAEDEAMVRDLVVGVLQKAGFTVLSAADGLEALKLSRSFPGTIEALVTDVAMPRMDGNELVRRIASERPDIRIVVMSGDQPAVGDLDAPRHAFLPKPFMPSVLLSAISGAAPKSA